MPQSPVRRARTGAAWLSFWVATALLPGAVAAQALSVTGTPGALKVTAAVAGSAPTSPAPDASTTYTVKTKKAAPMKITAQLTSAMPAGVTLKLALTPIAGATGVPAVTLSVAAQAVLDNITNNTNKS
ncbi:MAG TPA: hypothetical protein VII52_01370, partial [Gemmatimonadaceae bacterium]